MQPHPFTKSLINKITGSFLILLAIGLQWALLVVYSGAEYIYALVDSLLTVGIMAVAGYTAWYVLSFLKVLQAQIALSLLVQFVCFGVSFMLLTIMGIEDTEIFVSSLPLRFLIGILAWVILLQWYSMLQKTETLENELIETIREEDKPVEVIDRISVKDGARIHIVHLEELHCLQASGDYVTLFTATGQYIKEQTMKYFEIHLPPTFVRIHRSTIINTDYIMRVELFGKETYQVRLKNGQSLRASNAGYKLLKERLSL
ncbi:LytTR family transcriptional regulator [Parabacteroides sp. OttesenSCG-928-G07]|nr:LytTR family transcriptional regulator [Parabacteroides sp. OttesenSCG-928-G07]